jgi:serine/threonine-protein kinase RsbW
MGDVIGHPISSPRLEWRVTLPATLEAVETFSGEFRLWRADNCEDLDAFGAELLIREALINSVVHGCANRPDKSVCCVLRVKKGRLIIVVRDDGAGFDWQAGLARKSAVSDTCGRGLEIFRNYASHLRFNPAGNSITLVKRF